MESNTKFTYTTNPGGTVSFVAMLQRTVLSSHNFDYKSTNENVFINLSFEKMGEAVKSVLSSIAKTESVAVAWDIVNLNDGKDLQVLRSDTEAESTTFIIGTHEIPLVQFSYYVGDLDYEDGSQTTTDVNVFSYNVSGIESIVNLVLNQFNDYTKNLVKTPASALVRWYVPTSHGGLKDYNFQIKKDWDLEPSHYPWIKTEISKYYQAFANSRAQIMVLYGEPGTGKTTFIRDMICELNLNSIISYDMKVITSDMTFVKYLSDKNFDAIIIEDADELLTGSRGDYNKIISKILNVSDGLIKLPKKKLILTTNLEKLHDIDPAIVRPGRCFDVMKFRAFTNEEFKKIALEMKLELTDEEKKRKSMTLAEIYSLRELRSNDDPLITSHNIKSNKIGFV